MKKDNQLLQQIIQEKLNQIDEKIQQNVANQPLVQRLESDKEKLRSMLQEGDLESTIEDDLISEASKKIRQRKESFTLYSLFLPKELPTFEELALRLIQENDPAIGIMIQLFSDRPDAQIQFVADKKKQKVLCLVAGNDILMTANKMVEEKKNLLLANHWSLPTKTNPNFQLSLSSTSKEIIKELSRILIWIAENIFEYDKKEKVRVTGLFE